MFLILLALALLSELSLGQDNPGTRANEIRITGRVIDASKLPLPGTVVTLLSDGTNSDSMEYLTDSNGSFSLTTSTLPAELRFVHPGFKPVTWRLTGEKPGRHLDIGTLMLEFDEVNEGGVSPVKPARRVKPITVCELLSNLKKLNKKSIAVIGRSDCEWSLIDQSCFLVEDRCPASPAKILLIDDWEQGMPKPPAHEVQIDRAAALQSISVIRKTTALGSHQWPQFKKAGAIVTFSAMADEKDEWAAAYGRVVIAPKQDGGFDGAFAALIMNPGALRTYEDRP